MTKKSPKIFVSSTINDLANHRAAVRDAILHLGAMPVLLEDQPMAGTWSFQDTIREWIDNSDVVILLVGHKYGSIDPQTGKGWVELEYEAIKKQNKPLLVFLAAEDAPWPPKHVDRDQSKINEFRHRLASDLVVRFFSGPKDLRAAVTEALSEFLRAVKEEHKPSKQEFIKKREVRIVRMLLSSPGDVSEERDRVTKAVFRFNQHSVEDSGIFVKLVRWEDMAPQLGPKAQLVINKQIGNYHLFCGIMWNRFGTPTEIASSGTKEEFDAAVHSWKNNDKPWITFYFCDRPASFTTPEQMEQKGKVLEFRNDLNDMGVVRSFNGTQEFEELVFEDLKRITKLQEFQQMLD